jgi:peptide/nickel transport system substrate-binding protein
VLPDFATKVAALQTGEMDWLEYVTPDLLPILRKKNIATPIASSRWGSPGYLRPNHLYPPFDKPAVRRALMSAIDQTEFMIAMQGEDTSLWSVPCGFFPPASPMASDAGMSALTGRRDDAAVKKALEAAGYQGEKLVLIVATEQFTKPLSDVAADVLKRIGMNVDYQAMDTGTLLQRRASLKPPAEGGWNLLASTFGGLDFLTPASHPLLRGNGKGAWPGWPDDPRIEELREAWFNAPDLAEQKRIGVEIQLQAFQSVPYWPLGLAQISTAYRRDITGVLEGFAKFWNVRRI